MFQRVDSPDSYPGQQDDHDHSFPTFPVPAYSEYARSSASYHSEHPTTEMLSALDPNSTSYYVGSRYAPSQSRASPEPYCGDEGSIFSKSTAPEDQPTDYYDVVDNYSGPSRPVSYSPPQAAPFSLSLVQKPPMSPTSGRFSFSQDRRTPTSSGSSPRTEYPASAISPMRYPQSPLTKDFVRTIPVPRAAPVGSSVGASDGSASPRNSF